VRIDSAVYQGYTIPPYYDSLVGKLIVHGKTRGECLMRLRRPTSRSQFSHPLQPPPTRNADHRPPSKTTVRNPITVGRTASHSLTRYGMQTILEDAVATVIEGDFEWDDEKALSNLDKHGVSFAEAATVFADPAAVYLDDGSGTDRMVVVGTSLRDRVLYVVHVERRRRDPQVVPREMFMNPETTHDSIR
jgi:uncharacterized DUF497 family protein